MDEATRILVDYINAGRAKRRSSDAQLKEIGGEHYIVDSRSKKPLEGVPAFSSRREARAFLLDADDVAWQEYQNLREEGDPDGSRALTRLQRKYGSR